MWSAFLILDYPPGNGSRDRRNLHWRDSGFAGKTIETSCLRQEHGVIIWPSSGQWNALQPGANDRIEPGDYLIAMGEPPSSARSNRCGFEIMKIVQRSRDAGDRSRHQRAVWCVFVTLMENAGTRWLSAYGRNIRMRSGSWSSAAKGTRGDGFVARDGCERREGMCGGVVGESR